MEERNMKRVLLSAVAVLVAFCFAVNAAEEAKATTLTGAVKVVKEGDKVKEITLTVACKADCKGCDKDVKYVVTDTAAGDVAKLDGKTAEVTGKVDAEKKTVAAEKAVEHKAAAVK